MTAVPDGMMREDQAAPEFGAEAGPSRLGQVIRLHPRTRQRHLDWLTWGLLQHGAENTARAPRPVHARAGTVAELPLFAEAFRHRRAIVPAAAYYQQRTIGRPAHRYAITRRDGQPLAIAGLWEAFSRPAGEIVRTYCIITTESAGIVADIHERMPLVLNEPDWAAWLGEEPGDPAKLLHPAAGDALVLTPM